MGSMDKWQFWRRRDGAHQNEKGFGVKKEAINVIVFEMIAVIFGFIKLNIKDHQCLLLIMFEFFVERISYIFHLSKTAVFFRMGVLNCRYFRCGMKTFI